MKCSWIRKKVNLKESKIIKGNRFGLREYSDDFVKCSIQELWEEVNRAKEEIRQLELQCNINKRAIADLEDAKLERLKSKGSN